MAKEKVCPVHQSSPDWDECTEGFEGCKWNKKNFKTYIVHTTIKAVVKCPVGDDPCDVVNESSYELPTPIGENWSIMDTEMIEIENQGEAHPTEHYLL